LVCWRWLIITYRDRSEKVFFFKRKELLKKTISLTSSSLSFSAAGAVVLGVHGVFVEAFLWESSPFLALASFLAIQHTFACRGTQDQTAVVVQPIDKREPRKEIFPVRK